MSIRDWFTHVTEITHVGNERKERTYWKWNTDRNHVEIEDDE